MADTPKTPMTHAAYEALLLQASVEALDRSRKLLEATKPLVTAAEGGSVIGVSVPNLDECPLLERKIRSADG